MFFRFAIAIIAIVLISLIGIAIEKRNLELRREISQQHYQTEEMLEVHARLRLQTQQLGATKHIIESAKVNEHVLTSPATPRQSLPLMRWQQNRTQ